MPATTVTTIIIIAVVFILIIIYLIKFLPDDEDCNSLSKSELDTQNKNYYLSIIKSYLSSNNLNIDNNCSNLPIPIKCNGSKSYEDFYYCQDDDTIIFFKNYNPGINYQTATDYLKDIAFYISKNMIQYFMKDGSVSYTNKVINSGKNISLSGALIGGAIAGDAGSIIGAQKDANKLENITIKHDETHTYVYYKDNDIVKVLDAQGNDFYTFILQLFPDKEYRYITNNLDDNIQKNDDEDIKQRLNKIENLYNEGFITKEEYSEKRVEILKVL